VHPATLILPLALLLAAPLAAQTVTGTAVPATTATNSEGRPLRFAALSEARGVLVVPMSGTTLPALPGIALDEASRTAISGAVAAAAFKGNGKETLALRGIGGWAQILLIGTGPLADATADARRTALRNAAGRAAQALAEERQPITLAIPAEAASDEEAAELALGYALGQYRFDRYKSDRKAPPAEPVSLVGARAQAAGALWRSRFSALAEAAALSRDLSNEPANMLYPESFVERVRAAFAGVAGVTIEVLDEAAMRRLGMGAILGVGQGSPRPPRLMTISYRGPGAPAAPLALVGKGITFDSGGISIKPGAGMWRMKMDMTGAATVVATTLSLARSGAPVHVVAVAALAENMPDGNAQRPGDIVRTMSGKTIEIINTDAEGRLVLADGIEYALDRFRPAAVVTVATLTGAVVNALDNEYAGLFGHDDGLIDAITAAGAATGEAVWRLPLHANYADDLRSPIADIRHLAEGSGPGASLGAHFVGHFMKEGTPWAHIDIAGVAWSESAGPVTPRGPTAWGVQLLDALARSRKP
jgi:leucyl aminopeptidase